jgi:hypothetical protein
MTTIGDFTAIEPTPTFKTFMGHQMWAWNWAETRGRYEVKVYASTWSEGGPQPSDTWGGDLYSWQVVEPGCRSKHYSGYASTLRGLRRSVSSAIRKLDNWPTI